MRLDEKRKKNNKSKDFINDNIDYNSLSQEDADNIKSKVFKGWIEPISEGVISEIMDRE